MFPSRSSSQFSDCGTTCGHTETMSSIPSSRNSAVIAAGSGQNSSSKRQSPIHRQWKKSATMTSIGMPRRRYSRATVRSSSCVE